MLHNHKRDKHRGNAFDVLIIAAAGGRRPSAAAQTLSLPPQALPGDFLTVVANQTGLPALRWTASSIHTARIHHRGGPDHRHSPG